MLRIWFGRTGSGKTHRVYAEMADHMQNGVGNMLLLVPPQASHTTERLLAERLGDRAPLFAEALTFKTLANRIFEAGGSLAESYIDDNGRIMPGTKSGICWKYTGRWLPGLNLYKNCWLR